MNIDVDRRDLACLMYTSGTTGRPKGAMLTHDNHLWNVVNSLSFGRGLRESDVTVTVAPMFHIGGLGIHTLPLLYVGGTNVLLPSFDPTQTLGAMSRERATVQFMVPAMWAALMSVPGFDDFDLSSLELAVSGGAPCPLPVIDFYQGKGLPFQEGFGMTETAPLVTVLDAENVSTRAGSIGRVAMHVDARIVDDGAALRWMLRIVCPAGEPFSLDATVMGDEDAEPFAAARAATTVTCTGRTQVVRLTVRTTSAAPMVATDLGMAYVVLAEIGKAHV